MKKSCLSGFLASVTCLIALVACLSCASSLEAGSRTERAFNFHQWVENFDTIDTEPRFYGRLDYMTDLFHGISDVRAEGVGARVGTWWYMLNAELEYTSFSALNRGDTNSVDLSLGVFRASLELPVFEWMWLRPIVGGSMLISEQANGSDDEATGGVFGIAADFYLSPELTVHAGVENHALIDLDRLHDIWARAEIGIGEWIWEGTAPFELDLSVGIRGLHGANSRLSSDFITLGLSLAF